MKTLHIVHCDIKPENILLTHEDSTDIKIIDFGTGCYEGKSVYSYIQSRYYRAPEIILGLPYTCAIDMWSVGCVLLELCLGIPLFMGENSPEHLLMIMEYIGKPPAKILLTGKRTKYFFDWQFQPLTLEDTEGHIRRPGSKNISELIGDSDFVDLIYKCLTWDGDKRITPEQALSHKWITSP